MRAYSYNKHPSLGSHEFRLLRLHAGSGKADLEGNLLRFAIPTRNSGTADGPRRGSLGAEFPPEPYSALSYHWGPRLTSPNKPFIKILDQGEAYSVELQLSLAGALRRLRSPDHHIYIWCDFICINQLNREEKSIQIQRLSEIYMHAYEVSVWLGEEAEGSEQAITFIKDCLDLDHLDRLVRDSLVLKEWAALSALMRRPWFQRRWIIQEIALAREAKLYCGKDVVDWKEFKDVVSLFAEREYEIKQLFRQSTAFRNHPDYLGDLTELGAVRLVFASDNLFRKAEDGKIMEHLLSLEALMSTLSAFQAAEPHDIIYAILWLANDARPYAPAESTTFLAGSKNDYNDTIPDGEPRNRMVSHVSSIDSTYSDILSPPEHSTRRRSISTHMKMKAEDVTRRHRAIGSLPSSSPRRRPISVGVSDPVSTSHGAQAHTYPPYPLVHSASVPAPVNPGSLGDNPNGDQPSIVEPSIASSKIVNESQRDQSNTARENAADHTQAYRENGSSRERSRSRPPTYNSSPLNLFPVWNGDPGENPIKDPRELRAVTGVLNKWVSQIVAKRIVINYRRSITEVCKDFLAFVIQHSKSLDMVCKPWAPDVPDLPSWIPRISRSAFGLGANRAYRRINADSLVGSPGIGIKPYKASQNRVATLESTSDVDSLCVNGIILGSIEEKLPAATAGIIPALWMTRSGWTGFDDLPPDAFWRTLVGNKDNHGSMPPGHWQRVCKDACRRRPVGGDLNTTEVIMYDCPTAVREFLERVQRVVWSRRLFFLNNREKRDTLGLAPGHAKKGDLVCVLFGCSVPVVLRKFVNGEPARKLRCCVECHCECGGCPNAPSRSAAPTSAGGKVHVDGHDVNDLSSGNTDKQSTKESPDTEKVHYEFIGECYVHGMMDGEALTGKNPHSREEHWFEMR